MLLTMALLRMLFGWPTPTELIFDRLFPLLTVEFFISSLVKAGGYTPLKLQGVFGALAGQIVVAGIGGVIYALYLRRRVPDVKRPNDRALLDPRGWSLIVPGVLAATVLFIVLLWSTLITNYRGLPPGTARLRVSVHADHSEAEIDALAAALADALGTLGTQDAGAAAQPVPPDTPSPSAAGPAQDRAAGAAAESGTPIAGAGTLTAAGAPASLGGEEP